MRKRLMLFAAALLAASAIAGCSAEDSSGPFEGDWVSSTAPRLSFEGSSWSDSEGDSGSFSYDGDYPVYTVTFDAAAGSFVRRATFLDTKTFNLCSIQPNGILFACHEYVYDQPTIH